MKKFGYQLLGGLIKLVAKLPLCVLYLISGFLYYIVYYIVKYRKKVVFENLRNSFPKKSEKEIEIIAKKFYRHFCDIIVEVIKLFHISHEEMARRFKLINAEIFSADLEKKKHFLFVLGHYNNWEWGTSVAMHVSKSYNFCGIYKPLTNNYFDDQFIKIRSQFGGIPIPINKTGRKVAEYIKSDKLMMLSFISDQSPVQGDIKYWTTFLNQDTPVYIGIENLARKIKQPVYFFRINKIKRGYYEIEAEKLCDDCNDLPLHQLTEMHVRALERQIMEKPEYWLWSHRRWKLKKDE